MLLNFALNNFTPSGVVSEVYFIGGDFTIINNCMLAQGSSTPYTTPFQVSIKDDIVISANPGGSMQVIGYENGTSNRGTNLVFSIVTTDENPIAPPKSITIGLDHTTFTINGHEDEGGSGTYDNPYGDLTLKVYDNDSSVLLETIPIFTDGSFANIQDLSQTQIPITKWAESTRFDLEAEIKYIVGEA